MKKKNTYIFIDAQNLHLSIRNDIYRRGKCLYMGWTIDYGRLFILLKERYKADRIFLFIGNVDRYKSLYKYLGDIGYILVQKHTSSFIDNRKVTHKGNVDTLLVLTAMKLIKEYQRGILVSGDGDFLCLIDYWNELGIFERLIIPNKYSYSHLLQKYRSKMDFVNEWREKISNK